MTAHELKAWRARHGLTQSQAADELGISVSDIANYERGPRRAQNEPSIVPNAIKRACDSYDRKLTLTSALKLKIKEKIQSNGPPGHITPEILQEILLEIVDAI